MKIELDLTEEEAELLEEAVVNYTDAGPGHGYGWQSIDMACVNRKVLEATELARKN